MPLTTSGLITEITKHSKNIKKVPSLFGRWVEERLNDTGISKEDFAYQVLPGFLVELIRRYLRVECDQSKLFLPKSGPMIIIANHSGFMGLDAVILGHEIKRHTRRLPQIIAHKLWFIRPEISVHVERFGLRPATLASGLELLRQGKILILFPEGEEGNFKPSRYRYRLRRFRRGFLRLALLTGAPIVPAVIVGAEETHITLSQIRWARPLLGTLIPIPLNVLPLPARWHIRFLPPLHYKKNARLAGHQDYVQKESIRIRHLLQAELHMMLKQRRHIYL